MNPTWRGEWLAARRRAPRSPGRSKRSTPTPPGASPSAGPACWASGRCCNFAKSGHLLYVTGLEAAYTISRLGACRSEGLSIPQVQAARDAGGCPFQVGNLCGVHPIRPLGCRVYFCDRSAQAWQQELYELELGRVREIHDVHDVSYRYAEWRGLLEQLTSARVCEALSPQRDPNKKRPVKGRQMPRRGLEPPCPFGHYHLKVARLPVSPSGAGGNEYEMTLPPEQYEGRRGAPVCRVFRPGQGVPPIGCF